ncbi:hypothetical protein [Natronobiforma cellulositropha]|uniref:hypothetical protein n=1 Tax=Natronobiforma cellulositropha TaxID=1679076 RepID=UPI0021D56D52|nr:hypothetical protein [Natronobiforma cellulositropha]
MNTSETSAEHRDERAARAAMGRVLATLLLAGAAVTAILFGVETSTVSLAGVGLFVVVGSAYVLADWFRR